MLTYRFVLTFFVPPAAAPLCGFPRAAKSGGHPSFLDSGTKAGVPLKHQVQVAGSELPQCGYFSASCPGSGVPKADGGSKSLRCGRSTLSLFGRPCGHFWMQLHCQARRVQGVSSPLHTGTMVIACARDCFPELLHSAGFRWVSEVSFGV